MGGGWRAVSNLSSFAQFDHVAVCAFVLTSRGGAWRGF